MNFNPMRLLRRQEQIDDVATAYIEGRETDRDQAELRAREVREPGLSDDLETIRQTVQLLRSMDQVKAPRSFALTHAPVQVRRPARSRMAMAPAVFAVAAAAIVGLLAVGNLANVVHQSDGSSNETSISNKSGDQFATGLAGEIESGTLPKGDNEISDSKGLSNGTTAQSDAARAVPTGTPGIPQPVGTLTPGEAAASLAPGGIEPTGPPLDFAGGGAQETVPVMPDQGIQTPGSTTIEDPDSSANLLPPATPGGTAESSTTKEDDRTSAIAVEPGPEGATPVEVLPLPRPTITIDIRPNVPGDSAASALESVDGQNNQPPTLQDPKQDGVTVPLWQLQTGFAVLAVIMAGAWMLLQRRLTA